jgi:hypothetical protein
MKKFLVAILALTALTINAQTFKDTFDSNSMGWTETSLKKGEAVIKDGVLHMESKEAGQQLEIHCFSTLDVTKNFEIKCDAIAKKISDDGSFGVILDYVDDGNYIAFVIYVNDKDYYAAMLRYKENRYIGGFSKRIKITQKRNSELAFSIKSTYQKLQFYINDMMALEARFIPLTSNGFGFFVKGKQTVDFDNVEFIQ